MDIALNLAARKELLALIAQSQQQFENYLHKLLTKLFDQSSQVQVAAMKSLSQLAPLLSDKQVKDLVEKLLAKLDDKNSDVQNKVGNSLTKLIIRLTDMQVKDLGEKILAKLDSKDSTVRATLVSSLGQLGEIISLVQNKEIVEKFLVRLNNKNIKRRTVSSHVTDVTAQISGVRGDTREDYMKRKVDNLFKELSSFNHAKELFNKITNTSTSGDSYNDVHVRVMSILGDLAPHIPQEQIIQVISMLRKNLGNWSSDVACQAIYSLGQFAAQIPEVKVKKLVEKLMVKLHPQDLITVGVKKLLDMNDDYINAVRVAVINSLDKFLIRLPAMDVQNIIEELLPKLNDPYWKVQDATIRCMCRLIVQIPEMKSKIIIEKLLLKLDDKDFYVKTVVIKSLAQIFSSESSLQWLQQSLLQANQKKVVEDLPNNETQAAPAILIKLYTYLDQKTLLQVVPQVNKDWRCWQKVHLQQQLEQQRLQIMLPPEESLEDVNEQEKTPQNSFSRFLPQ